MTDDTVIVVEEIFLGVIVTETRKHSPQGGEYEQRTQQAARPTRSDRDLGEPMDVGAWHPHVANDIYVSLIVKAPWPSARSRTMILREVRKATL